MNVAETAGRRVVSTLAESVYDNPVVTKEFRTRMRGKRAFVVMGTYVLFLAGVLFLTFYSLFESSYYSGASAAQLVNQNIGMKLFASLTWTQAILLAFIVPALTSGALTQELEKKTIEMLALTRLTPGRIVVGKQLSGFLYALVLLVCSAPLAGMCLMFGGISPAEIAVTYALLVAWAFLFTSTGVFWSSLMNRTAASTLLSYGFCLGYTLLTFVLGSWSHFSYMYGRSMCFVLDALNPGWGTYTSFTTAKVSGLSIPAGAVAFGLHIAIALLLLLVAITHVRHLRAQRALPIRLLVIGITTGLLWLVVGNALSLSGPISQKYTPDFFAGFSIVPLVLLMLGASVFATGEVGQGTRYGLFTRKVFQADLGGSIGFMLLWGLMLYGGLGLTILRSIGLGQAHVSALFWAAYFGLGIAILAITAGTSSVGILISSLVTARKGAAALVVLFAIVAFAAYAILLMYYTNGVSDNGNPVWQLAAFWPLTPIYGMSDSWRIMPKLWWPTDLSWVATAAAYLLLTVAALRAASAAAKRCGGVRED